jgi:hypothetical protein
MFCAHGLIFGRNEGVRYCFHVLRSRSHFPWNRGRRVLFSSFARRNSFPAVTRASDPVFKFCAFGLIFSGTKGVGSRFHVLRSLTHFRRCRGRPVPFSCFVLPDSFPTVLRASALFFQFSAPGLVFGGTEGTVSCFQVLSAWTHFRRYRGRRILYSSFALYRGRRVPFSCFALPDTFSTVPRASGPFSCFVRLVSFLVVQRLSGPVFKFCVPGVVFGSTAGIKSRYLVLRARTPFRRYRGRRLPFSCFVLPDSFSAVPRTSALGSFSAVLRATAPIFIFCAPKLVFGGTEGVGSHFHVLHARIHFRRYRGRPVPFSCFALPNSFSKVPSASSTVFMFCAPGLVFDGNEGVGSHLHLFWR